jgi:hypothetical protein
VTICEQRGADPDRLQAVLERLPMVHVEMDPGSALFFDSNLLHCSDSNKIEKSRWSLICCYNAARNDLYKDSCHPRYTPLEVWPDSRVKEVGRTQWASMSDDVEGGRLSAGRGMATRAGERARCLQATLAHPQRTSGGTQAAREHPPYHRVLRLPPGVDTRICGRRQVGGVAGSGVTHLLQNPPCYTRPG